MRVSKARQDRNRARIVAVAARLMRQRGIAGIGIDALAKAAGMTHGAIYSHFTDKDELAAAAIAHALAQSSEKWHAAANAKGAPGSAEYFNELVRQYVSRWHRDHPGQGCAVAALAPDARRHGRKVRHALSDHIEALADDLKGAVAGGGAGTETDPGAQARAIAAMVAMVGAIVLARAVEDAALSDRILLTVRRSLMQPPRA
jgi:TetR/AcrR family transcriptional repressor of nem operon